MYLNIGVFEVTAIAIIGAVIIGPKKLPFIGKKIGKTVNQVNKETKSMRKEITEIKDIVSLKEKKEK